MQETPNKPQQIAFCELFMGNHPTGFCPPALEKVNYMGNQQQMQTPYQGNQGYQRRNNTSYGQGWRQDTGPSNRQNPYQNNAWSKRKWNLF